MPEIQTRGKRCQEQKFRAKHGRKLETLSLVPFQILSTMMLCQNDPQGQEQHHLFWLLKSHRNGRQAADRELATS